MVETPGGLEYLVKKYSHRQLKRHLKRLHLKRRGASDMNEILTIVQEEIEGSGCTLGCRMMTKRLLSKHSIGIGRDTVMSILNHLDPMGVQDRKRHCFTRRAYANRGPNYLIHIDGYDKIKPYGFAVHGAICGYSRRVLWLNVAKTNNDPRVAASYFLNYVEEIQGVPHCIRMDGGTENIHIEDLQTAFRCSDATNGENFVIIGSSNSNQRIERWWRSLRSMGLSFWIEFLKNAEFQGIFSTANQVHIECLQFCFMPIIQNELDLIKQEWNSHNIRSQYNTANCEYGKPDMMYFHPEIFGTVDFKNEINMEDVHAVRQICGYSSNLVCSEEMYQWCSDLLQESGKSVPQTKDEALDTFQFLLQHI